MERVLDPEGAHLASLRRLADWTGQRVLELGCGDGRLTVSIAPDAAHVLAFDPDAESVEKARDSLPAELADRVEYRVASGRAIEIAPGSFDLVLFSWRSDESSMRTSCTSCATWSTQSVPVGSCSTCR